MPSPFCAVVLFPNARTPPVPVLFFHHPAPSDIHTLSLHDPLPICTRFSVHTVPKLLHRVPRYNRVGLRGIVVSKRRDRVIGQLITSALGVRNTDLLDKRVTIPGNHPHWH